MKKTKLIFFYLLSCLSITSCTLNPNALSNVYTDQAKDMSSQGAMNQAAKGAMASFGAGLKGTANSQGQELSPNYYNNERNNEFVYIDAISNNRNHHNEYVIVDLNLPAEKNKNPVMKKNAEDYPYYEEILEEVINALKPHGYKITEIGNIKKDSLFPAYISFSYIEKNRTLFFNLKLNNYTIRSRVNNQPISYIEAVNYIKTKKDLSTIPVWSILIGIDVDNPMNSRLQLSAIIKCASPYFNTNFKGTITCKR